MNIQRYRSHLSSSPSLIEQENRSANDIEPGWVPRRPGLGVPSFH
jgi:hypothetical protein